MSAATEPIPMGRWWGRPLAEARWVLEAARLTADPVWLGRGGIPRGDRRDVVLLPGFLAGDNTLTPLGGWLWRIGYRPSVCGFVANVDCSERALERVEQQVLRRHARSAVDGARQMLHRTGRARSTDCLTYRCQCAFAADFWAAFPEERVRLTSVYSKGDGVVRWQAQVVPYADCVEVTGSHVGLIVNRKSYRAIAGALARPELER